MAVITNEQIMLLRIACNTELDSNALDLKTVNWNLLHELSIEQRIFPIVYRGIKEIIPKEYAPIFQSYNNSFLEKQKNILLEIGEISALAHNNEINILFVKGIIFAQLIYDDIFGRVAGDIDILIDEADVHDMHNILMDLGYYIPTGDLKDKTNTVDYPILKGHNAPHEYANYYKEVKPNEYLSVELQRHIHTTITGHSMKKVLTQRQRITLGNVKVETLNIPYTFLYLCENAYTDSEKIGGKARLKEYIDLYLFLKKYHNRLNWSELQKLSNQYQMLHLVYRVLNNLSFLYKDLLNDDILKLFDLENLSYDPATSPSGFLINWKSDFLERLFNKVDRNEEIRMILKEHCFSSQNINMKAKYRPKNVEGLDITDETHYLYFYDEKNGWKICYLPCVKNDQHLYFYFMLPDDIINAYDKYEVKVVFTDSDMKNNQVTQNVRLLMKNKKITYTYNGHSYVAQLHGNNIVEVRVPFNFLGALKKENKLIVGYNVVLNQVINRNFSRYGIHLIGTQNTVANQDVCWHPSILEIETHEGA